MPALPDPPLVQRSWLARGEFNPSPRWGRTGHAIMYETQVTFFRRAPAKDQSGGFKGTATADFYTVMAHVELDTESVTEGSITGIVGIGQRRHYWVQMDLPADTDDIPSKGDRMRFTDATGADIDVAIDEVDIPEGTLDHVEITTEDIL